eukprot:6367705-Prymnesium_polylepis.1
MNAHLPYGLRTYGFNVKSRTEHRSVLRTRGAAASSCKIAVMIRNSTLLRDCNHDCILTSCAGGAIWTQRRGRSSKGASFTANGSKHDSGF